ncbi:hypothetical protein [Paracoccus tegillarcae]
MLTISAVVATRQRIARAFQELGWRKIVAFATRNPLHPRIRN